MGVKASFKVGLKEGMTQTPFNPTISRHYLSHVGSMNSATAIHPHYKGKGVEWGKSLLLVEHIWICLLISKTTNRNMESTEGVRANVVE